MDILNFVPNLPGANTLEEGFSRRSRRIHHENEQSNMIAITQLVLKTFIDAQMRGNRMVEAETREIVDLLIMIEKILWHGFRNVTSVIGFKKPEAKLWSFIMESAKSNDTMNDLCQTFYESWALLSTEKCLFLAGSFLALNVFDCNLTTDFDQLQEQICSFDITTYLKLPTLTAGHINADITDYENEAQNDLKVILDQKQYLEERNRQLTETLERFRKKAEHLHFDQKDMLESKAIFFNQRLKDLEQEREILQARLSEKEDVVILLQTQLNDTKKVNEDLYEKLRATEATVRTLKNDAKAQKEAHFQQITELNNALDSFNAFTKATENNTKNNLKLETNPSDFLQKELRNKTQHYMDSMFNLSATQQELSRERENSARLDRKCQELSTKVGQLNVTEETLSELRKKYDNSLEELRHCRQAMEELGAHLSSSKIKIVELEEEILPINDFEWIRDDDVKKCRRCETGFSVMQRRHHCRRCGSIFCHECSASRVKLPSNPKPVRVCQECFVSLKNKQLSNQITSTS